MKTVTKTLTFLFLLVVGLSFQTFAQDAPSWKIDESHTSVNFSINHFFSAVTGKFKEFEGEFNLDLDNLDASKASFVIDVASVDTDEPKRDKHLQSKDFFNAKNFPKMKFESTGFTKKSDKEFVVKGNLTIRDVTKLVELPVKVSGQMEHPMKRKTLILGLVVEYTMNRNDFGVGTGDWAATAVVGDEVRISIPMELNRKQ